MSSMPAPVPLWITVTLFVKFAGHSCEVDRFPSGSVWLAAVNTWADVICHNGKVHQKSPVSRGYCSVCI